jgi:WhiB family redox-sensing transcriptional regulator
MSIANPSPAGPSSPVDPALLLRSGPVAAWLGVTTRTLANWAAAGKIPFHHTPQGHLRFVATELAPAVAAMGRAVPPLPASIAGQQHQAAGLGVVDPHDSLAGAEPNQACEDAQPDGQGPVGHTPTASVEVSRFLVKQRFSGACDQATAELFFDQGRDSGHATRDRHRAAKAICALCPIRAECNLVGRADLTLEGIWGGETHQERRQARRRARHGQPTPAVPPGNPDGRLRVQQAFQHAQRAGLHAAAGRLGVPVATLRRVFDLSGLDQPARADPPWTCERR